jgi:serine phosphatase RsbU (regulator of sigma subunit)
VISPGKLYSNTELCLVEDDILYIFSDEYVDQFGGSQNKKFKYRRFRFLINTIHQFSADNQKSILEGNIKTWMGSSSQVDDILVIGFKSLS